MNSWEIAKRERVEAAGLLDLKDWTRAQILEEAEKAYLRAWDRRESLGKLPVGALGEYVEPGDYPADVRGTLRDAVSYLFAELLADSSLWTPEQSNDVSRLDLANLIASDGRGADAVLTDHAAHPVAKLVAVFADLEAWHAGSNERAAELEARLERLRRLHDAFTEAPDRAAIRKDLEVRLPRYKDISWWALGMAELAAFRQAEDAPDNLIRAREAALEGFRAYPQSPGGRRANAIDPVRRPGVAAGLRGHVLRRLRAGREQFGDPEPRGGRHGARGPRARQQLNEGLIDRPRGRHRAWTLEHLLKMSSGLSPASLISTVSTATIPIRGCLRSSSRTRIA